MGMALNAASKHPEEAKIFLNWIGSANFAEIFNANLPGFFALSNHVVEIDDPISEEFLKWRQEYEGTFRITYKTISSSEVFNTDTELNRVATLVMNGVMTPVEACEHLEEGLASWYEPHQ